LETDRDSETADERVDRDRRSPGELQVRVQVPQAARDREVLPESDVEPEPDAPGVLAVGSLAVGGEERLPGLVELDVPPVDVGVRGAEVEIDDRGVDDVDVEGSGQWGEVGGPDRLSPVVDVLVRLIVVDLQAEPVVEAPFEPEVP